MLAHKVAVPDLFTPVARVIVVILLKFLKLNVIERMKLGYTVKEQAQKFFFMNF